MSDALTYGTWVNLLDKLISQSFDDKIVTLATMLRDLLIYCDDPMVGKVFDTYASKLLSK